MKKRRVLLILISLSIYTNVLAQEEQGALCVEEPQKATIENIDSIKLVANSLQRELMLRDSVLQANKILIGSIRRNAKQDSLRLTVAANHQRDSLLNIIRSKDDEITTLKANIGFVDTCMVKLANRWLYERFDRDEVEEAIKYFDRIYSSRLKEGLSIVQELLHNYEHSYQEFQTILKDAQNDINRENPFACEEYRNKYKRKIENMMYYRKYYNGDWNIKYLNGQIDQALEIINNHQRGKFADFSSLIDTNF